MAAAHSVDLDGWGRLFDSVLRRCAGRFARRRTHARAGKMVHGLIAGLDDKNCWTLAEHLGDRSPDGLQYLLSRAKWDHDGVRDDVRDFVAEHLGAPDAVLVVDETGDLKKGRHTVGVQRQYTGTAGRIENAQVSVHLTYATAEGHALIDRELYLPKSWTDDRGRCRAQDVPEGRAFATKPALAGRMIVAAAAHVPAKWAAGDEVYGADPVLRRQLADHGLGYVLGVACSHRVTTADGTARVDELAQRLPSTAWRSASAGEGAKGRRLYRWARIPIDPGEEAGAAGSGVHAVLIRRHPRTKELAYFRCYSPTSVSLAAFVRVAGLRWRIEESFQAAKGQVGLDQHQVRTWTSWYRWHTLVMLGYAFLAVAAVISRRRAPSTPTLIRLSINEIRKLFTTLIDNARSGRSVAHLLHCSWWRRHHQARARICHYKRRGHTP
ncbi:IS701 family transposase [Rhodococcus ruber]